MIPKSTSSIAALICSMSLLPTLSLAAALQTSDAPKPAAHTGAQVTHHVHAPSNPAVLPGDFALLTGTWTCKGSFRGGKPHESVYTVAAILNGTWIEMTEHDILPVTGYDAKYLIGNNPAQKRLIEFDANTFGAAVYNSETGWQEHRLQMTSEVFTGPDARYALNRFRYSVPSANSFVIDWEISRSAAKPSWIPADHLACTRTL